MYRFDKLQMKGSMTMLRIDSEVSLIIRTTRNYMEQFDQQFFDIFSKRLHHFESKENYASL